MSGMGEAIAVKNFERGVQQCKQQGIQQGLTKTATAMLAKGFAPMVVTECTGLSLEQVMQLAPRS